ncbi:MAG: hypothetical protein RI973_1102, partial [Bacteroidota bacterium]
MSYKSSFHKEDSAYIKETSQKTEFSDRRGMFIFKLQVLSTASFGILQNQVVDNLRLCVCGLENCPAKSFRITNSQLFS